MAVGGELSVAVLQTLRRVVSGFVFGAALGVLCGAILASSSKLDRYAGPVLYALLQVPGLVWVPALIAIFGIDESFKWASIALTVFFPVASNSYEAIRGISHRYLELGAVLCLTPSTRMRTILLPAIMPRLVAGLRIGMSKAWLVVVFVELYAASSGLGYLMDEGRTTFQMDVVLVAVFATGILGYGMDQLLAFTGAHFESRPGRS
jgi:sulfonate transport system permease protein